MLEESAGRVSMGMRIKRKRLKQQGLIERLPLRLSLNLLCLYRLTEQKHNHFNTSKRPKSKPSFLKL